MPTFRGLLVENYRSFPIAVKVDGKTQIERIVSFANCTLKRIVHDLET